MNKNRRIEIHDTEAVLTEMVGAIIIKTENSTQTPTGLYLRLGEELVKRWPETQEAFRRAGLYGKT